APLTSAPAPPPPPSPAEEEEADAAPSVTASAAPARATAAVRARVARAQLVGVTGSDFDPAALEAVYRAHADDVARCGGRAFGRDPSLATIDAWLQLSPSGDRGCHADAEGAARSEMCTCLLTAAVAWSMPQPASPWIFQTKPTADFHVRVTAE